MPDRQEIANRHGIPGHADSLTGETREELEADAAAKAAVIGLFAGHDEEPEQPVSDGMKPLPTPESWQRRTVEAAHPEASEPDNESNVHRRGQSPVDPIQESVAKHQRIMRERNEKVQAEQARAAWEEADPIEVADAALASKRARNNLLAQLAHPDEEPS